ncbi:pantoate--beta-alanine ligase [Dokdonia sinensis]|uniref:Pantothenate synthetase n=1 Tax=Dokdonia sinensis TaxID=2479847 RepID=A0A3M0FUM6_9FLAO|nr:pantoate--beta-alanine ligase [Dokdonia sinensis]RMB56394.1 pantoate--beta-alanine ligase [Dokdonia sinensis]
MRAITSKEAILKAVLEAKKKNNTVGFVPTMGALHKGHLSLIDYALECCEVVVVSIFVNPTQFNNAADLEKYPRTVDADLELLSSYQSQVLVYVPSVNVIYEGDVVSKSYNFGSLEDVMEGEHRPGHFDGVGTVLNHLFRQVQPDKAFFGEKDYQQLKIVEKLVEKEKLSVQILGCPIYRQPDGLAMSSRNARLTQKQLATAPFIHKILKEARERFSSTSANELRKWVQAQFASQDGLELEYFEIANIKNLSPLSRKRKNQKYRAFIAAFAGEIRLIDNIALN